MASAQQAHDKFHLNVTSLRLAYKISKEQALKIVKACPLCTELATVPHLGVNPLGLLSNYIWQMDVTYEASFGKLGFVRFCGYLFRHALCLPPPTQGKR